MNPYIDERNSSKQFVRVFSEQVNNDELIWHRDRKDREVKVLDGVDWKLQYDNELPFIMRKDETYSIKAEQYHRILKGKDKLVLEITEK